MDGDWDGVRIVVYRIFDFVGVKFRVVLWFNGDIEYISLEFFWKGF